MKNDKDRIMTKDKDDDGFGKKIKQINDYRKLRYLVSK